MAQSSSCLGLPAEQQGSLRTALPCLERQWPRAALAWGCLQSSKAVCGLHYHVFKGSGLRHIKITTASPCHYCQTWKAQHAGQMASTQCLVSAGAAGSQMGQDISSDIQQWSGASSHANDTPRAFHQAAEAQHIAGGSQFAQAGRPCRDNPQEAAPAGMLVAACNVSCNYQVEHSAWQAVMRRQAGRQAPQRNPAEHAAQLPCKSIRSKALTSSISSVLQSVARKSLSVCICAAECEQQQCCTCREPQKTNLSAGMMQSSSTSSQVGGSSSCMAACRGPLRNHCSRCRWLGVAAAAQPHRMWHRGSTAMGSGCRTLQADRGVLFKAAACKDPDTEALLHFNPLGKPRDASSKGK